MKFPLALGAALACVSCGPSLSDLASDAEKLRATGADALSTNPKQCTALRKATEPDLFGWDSGSRGKVKATAEQGLVVVHFEEHGCDIAISVLSCTTNKTTYKYTPRHAQQSRIAENDVDLYAHFPVAVADLRARVRANRGIRADYRVEGVDMIPIEASVSPADLKGSECAQATHVVSAIHRGAFAVASGALTDLHAGGTLFDASVRLEHQLGVFDGDGYLDACELARTKGEKTNGCDEPLRIELQPLGRVEDPPAPTAPAPPPPSAAAEARPPPREPREPREPATRRSSPRSDVAEPPKPRTATERAIDAPLSARKALASALVPPPRPPSPAPPVVLAPPRLSGKPCPPGMAEIPGGVFVMGSNEGPADEQPAHSMAVDPFCLDRQPVTVADYDDCPSCRKPTGATGMFCNTLEREKDDHPQNCVSWEDAAEYCRAAGKALPTEAQWEYAARGAAEERAWPWGSLPPSLNRACWGRWQAGEMGTCPVGSYPPGAFGLLDMAGNVWEWTADWFQPYAGHREVPIGRALRGGAWSNIVAEHLRTTARKVMWPGSRDDHIGFRCAVAR